MTVQITKADNGWVVVAGCITLVFEDSSKLLSELARYFANSDQVTKEYVAKYRQQPLDVTLDRNYAEPVPMNTPGIIPTGRIG